MNCVAIELIDWMIKPSRLLVDTYGYLTRGFRNADPRKHKFLAIEDRNQYGTYRTMERNPGVRQRSLIECHGVTEIQLFCHSLVHMRAPVQLSGFLSRCLIDHLWTFNIL